MRRTIGAVTIAAGFLAASPAHAALIPFSAALTGSQEVPPTSSLGTGLASVVLDNVADTITANLSFSGLTSPAILAHIHGPAPVGVNAAPVLFPFTGVPSATSGAIPAQVFAITPTEIGEIEAGLFYVNVHTTNFPGGEIRGQLARVPEPAGFGLLGLGFAWIALVLRRGASTTA